MPAESDTPSPPAPSPARRRRDVISLLVTGLPALALAALALSYWGDDWTPSQDLALIDLRIRDVGSSDTPLLGPYSRFGWNHPGPLMFWLLAPVLRLFGSGASAGLVGAGLQNAIMLVAVGVIARRVGGRRFQVIIGVGVAVLCASLGTDVLLSTWNPWLLLLPLVLLVVAAWGVATGDVVLVPVVLGVASYVVQTHIGLVPVVTAIVATGVALGVLRSCRHRDLGSCRRALSRRWRLAAVSLLVLGVTWAGPVAHELGDAPSNLRAILTQFTDSDEASVGWAGAWNVATRQLSLVGPWFGGAEPVDFLGAVAPGSALLALPFLVLFGVAGWRSWRRDRRLWALWVLVAVGLAAGFAATARITGLPFVYLIRWWWVLAVVGWVVIVLSWLPGGGERDAGVGRTALGAGVRHVASWVGVGVVAVASTLLIATASHPTHDEQTDAVVAQLAAGVVPQLGGGIHELRVAGPKWPPYLSGLGNELDRAGIGVAVADEFAAAFGHSRTLAQIARSGADPVTEVLVVATGLAVEDFVVLDDHELLAEYDPLTPADRVELIALQRSAIAALAAEGRPDPGSIVEQVSIGELEWLYTELDPAVIARVSELLTPGDRVAVFRVTP
jgi:hypothetical protein